jgi:predicted transcriptional regulator
VAPGAAVQFAFNFTNLGNRADTLAFDVTEAPLNWTAVVGPSRSVDIGPGATLSELLTVIPSPNLNESLAQSYDITVRVSNGDHSFVQNISFEVQVAPVYAIDLEQPGGQDHEVNLFVTGRQTISLVLYNEGNAADNISLSLSGPQASWGRFDTPVVQLGYGESTSVRLDITVPATTAAPGAYALSVSAASLGRPGLVAERMLYIIVKNFDPGTLVPRLKVFPPSPQLKLTEGDTLSFPVSVLCTGSDIVNVSIRITSSAGLDISYEILVPPENLSAGENYTFMVVLHAGHPNGTVSRGTIEVQAVGEGVVGSKQQIEVTLQRAPRPALVVSMEGLGIALAIFLALGGIAVGWNEVVLLALLNLFMPLYVKLRRVEVLDHYTRGQIHGYIIANPGEHYNSIRAQLRLKNGTLAYHLRVLEREGFVKTARDGMFKRFYPEKASIPRRKSEFSAIQEIVLENVSSSPGITQNELARKMGVSSQVVNYHVRNLVNAGVLRLEREGRVTRCFPK